MNVAILQCAILTRNQPVLVPLSRLNVIHPYGVSGVLAHRILHIRFRFGIAHGKRIACKHSRISVCSAISKMKIDENKVHKLHYLRSCQIAANDA